MDDAPPLNAVIPRSPRRPRNLLLTFPSQPLAARTGGPEASGKEVFGWWVPLDKSEGVVKAKFCLAVFFAPHGSQRVEDEDSGNLTVNHFSVESFHQPSIRPCATAMILLSESRSRPGRERPINATVYPPWRTTRGTRELLSIRTISGYPFCVRSIQ